METLIYAGITVVILAVWYVLDCRQRGRGE